MKKLLAAVLLTTLAACSATGSKDLANINPQPKPEAVKTSKISSSCKDVVYGVRDKDNGGSIYYTKTHKLYKFIKLDPKQGDREFCGEAAAKSAGFHAAPEHFQDSTYNLIQCLKAEGSEGTCHSYIAGIYQSLKIYDKVCGPAGITKAEMASVVESHAEHAPNGMEVGKYHGAADAFLHKYPCK